MELFSIERFMGYGLYVELLDKAVSDKVVDTFKHQPNLGLLHQHDLEVWFFGRLHVVISNETVGRQQLQD